MNRRTFVKYSLGCLTAANISSCGYHKVRMGGDSPSKEIVSSVLISADEKTLVVMTHQFHYIFAAPSALVQTLKGTFHPYVEATVSQFHVDINGKTSGTLSLFVSNAPTEALGAAVTAGFTRTSRGAVFTTTLHGDRYSAGDVQATEQFRLNKTYEIEVTSEGYGWKPSPIGTAAGELAMGGLILFSLPIALVSGQK